MARQRCQESSGLARLDPSIRGTVYLFKNFLKKVAGGTIFYPSGHAAAYNRGVLEILCTELVFLGDQSVNFIVVQTIHELNEFLNPALRVWAIAIGNKVE